MPKKANKKVKRAFDVTVLEQQLEDYNKDKLLHVVDRVCRMSMSDTAGLQATADTLLNKALHANLPDRKPLAVLTRRLHDRLPRCGPLKPRCATHLHCLASPRRCTATTSLLRNFVFSCDPTVSCMPVAVLQTLWDDAQIGGALGAHWLLYLLFNAHHLA